MTRCTAEDPAVIRFQKIQEAAKAGRLTSEQDYGEFAALAFVMLNLPAQQNADGTFQRGVVTTQGKFGDGPALWETYKNSTEIFRAAGAKPQPWNAVNEFPDGVTPLTTAELLSQFGSTNSPWLHFFPSSRMIDGQQIVDDRGRLLWYDVRCNQDYFDYVTAGPYPLYNLEGQQQARNDATFEFDFPAQTIELKATWRVLDSKDDDSRFWTAYGAWYDATNTLVYAKVGLTALHVMSHLQSNWIWMTYEQEDNPQKTYQYFLGNQGDPIGANPTLNPAAGAVNSQLAKATQGTKWQHYRLMGWQFDEVDQNGNPVVLANTNIETYFPQTSSCMSCHAMANIGPPETRRLNFWKTDASGIQGRVGLINFPEIVQELGFDPAQFKQMNYAWSLREAQSTATAPAPSTSK